MRIALTVNLDEVQLAFLTAIIAKDTAKLSERTSNLTKRIAELEQDMERMKK